MPPNTIVQAISLKTFDGSTSEDSITVEKFSAAEALRHAITKSALVLGITFLTVFIPGLHLITVPSGLIIATILFVNTSRTTQIIKQTKVKCPACKQDMGILNKTYKLPFKETCDNCHREVIINVR